MNLFVLALCFVVPLLVLLFWSIFIAAREDKEDPIRFKSCLATWIFFHSFEIIVTSAILTIGSWRITHGATAQKAFADWWPIVVGLAIGRLLAFCIERVWRAWKQKKALGENQ